MSSEFPRFYIMATAERKPDRVSRLICRWMQKRLGAFDDLGSRPWSHIAVVVMRSSQDATVYQAHGPGITKDRSMSALTNTCDIIHCIDVTSSMKVKSEYAIGWLDSKVGLPYATFQLAYFVFPWLVRIPFLTGYLKNKMLRYICSELGAEFINLVTEQKVFEDPDFVDPLECIKVLRIFTMKGFLL